MYTCRDLWPTCRCIQLVRTFVWTLLPPASSYMHPFDWIESIHPFPTASSLSLSHSNPSSWAATATVSSGGGDCDRRRRRLLLAAAVIATTAGAGVDRDYRCSFPAPSAERRWHPQLPVQVLARLVVSHGSIAPNARSRSLGARARLAICITLAPKIFR
jgi:hypothetical protein